MRSRVTGRRLWIDPPDEARCDAEITMRDGSLARCGKWRKVGNLCTQHHKISLLGMAQSMTRPTPEAPDATE